MSGMHDWRTVLGEVKASHLRLTGTLATLTEAEMRGPSALTGWTRGHLAHHVARNADSYWRLLEWARTGVEHPQYASAEARAAEIDEGAHLPAGLLSADNAAASARFEEQARTLPAGSRDATVRAVGGWPHPAWYVLYRRWREVEIHHVDLDAGYTAADWPLSYVRWELEDTLASLRAANALAIRSVTATDLGLTVRLGGDGPDLSLPSRPLLAYLTGRTEPPGAVPAAPSWPLAPAVDWNKA
ncbi:maleylpyruvate isomerase family mycothiol-dependent enzyme [Actinocorallia longicatena]|uniref:Maleylpyruvate isomerase family mycothiol-dependent enzyme n=1 Tax=Actinocorallia longicatena TaxID=111803 RepID=A0ABP6QHP8_9ACTN